MEVGCADWYKNIFDHRDVHIKLKLKTKLPPTDKTFKFGVLFTPLNPPAAAGSDHHRILAGGGGGSSGVSDVPKPKINPNCVVDTRDGNRWDCVMVSYNYTIVPTAATFKYDDLWVLADNPDTVGKGTSDAYLVKDC